MTYLLHALYVAYFVVGVLLAALLVRFVLRSKRRLDARVAQFREEQAEQQGPPPNPWMALAELYAEDARKDEEARRSKKRSA